MYKFLFLAILGAIFSEQSFAFGKLMFEPYEKTHYNGYIAKGAKVGLFIEEKVFGPLRFQHYSGYTQESDQSKENRTTALGYTMRNAVAIRPVNALEIAVGQETYRDFREHRNNKSVYIKVGVTLW